MSLVNNLILAAEWLTALIAGLVGVLSMAVARLLDWYFPKDYHRPLNDENHEHKHEVEKLEEDRNE